MSARAILLVGPISTGKSLLVERLAASLRADGIDVSGFVQRGVFDERGEKVGYDLVGLSSGARRVLARRDGAGQAWRFEADAFRFALAELRPAALTIIDEVGPLELAGGGHAEAVERALGSRGTVLVVVREALEEGAAKWLSSKCAPVVLRFDQDRGGTLAGEIRALLATGLLPEADRG